MVAVSRGVLELRLEAPAEQQDEICVPQLPDVSGRRLEVVRLCSGRREVANVHGRPADLLRGKRERIEGRDDARSLIVGAAAHRSRTLRTQPRPASKRMILILISLYRMAVAEARQADYETLLAEHGLRPTRQRVSVLGALASRDDATAQQIHALLADAGERVGLATVYRTLKSLSESGVVDTLVAPQGRDVLPPLRRRPPPPSRLLGLPPRRRARRLRARPLAGRPRRPARIHCERAHSGGNGPLPHLPGGRHCWVTRPSAIPQDIRGLINLILRWVSSGEGNGASAAAGHHRRARRPLSRRCAVLAGGDRRTTSGRDFMARGLRLRLWRSHLLRESLHRPDPDLQPGNGQRHALLRPPERGYGRGARATRARPPPVLPGEAVRIRVLHAHRRRQSGEPDRAADRLDGHGEWSPHVARAPRGC